MIAKTLLFVGILSGVCHSVLYVNGGYVTEAYIKVLFCLPERFY